MVLFGLFFVLVLVLVLVLDRSIMRLYHSIPFNAFLGQEFGKAMHAKRSITITSTAALSTSTMRANRVSARSKPYRMGIGQLHRASNSPLVVPSSVGADGQDALGADLYLPPVCGFDLVQVDEPTLDAHTLRLGLEDLLAILSKRRDAQYPPIARA
jgi:hypothetical protein